MKMSGFVENWEKKFKFIVIKENHTNLNVLLEAYITTLEYQKLIQAHKQSDVEVDENSLKPFIDFLANRWKRISGTLADYMQKRTEDTQVNNVCRDLAVSIVRSLTSVEQKTSKEAKYLTYLKPKLDNNAEENAKLSAKEKDDLLGRRIAESGVKLYQTGAEVINLMVNVLPLSNWKEFLDNIDLNTLKELIMRPDLINKHKTIYDALVALAEDKTTYDNNALHSQAKLFCVIELYKKIREDDPNYTGLLGGITGIRKGRRITQADCLQDFIISDEPDFKKFMAARPDDNKSIYSGHMASLAKQVSKIKDQVPQELNECPGMHN